MNEKGFLTFSSLSLSLSLTLFLSVSSALMRLSDFRLIQLAESRGMERYREMPIETQIDNLWKICHRDT